MAPIRSTCTGDARNRNRQNWFDHRFCTCAGADNWISIFLRLMTMYVYYLVCRERLGQIMFDNALTVLFSISIF